jgi:hypothetical protein
MVAMASGLPRGLQVDYYSYQSLVSRQLVGPKGDERTTMLHASASQFLPWARDRSHSPFLRIYEDGQLVALTKCAMTATSDSETVWFGTDADGLGL